MKNNRTPFCSIPGCGNPRHKFPSGARARRCVEHEREVWAARKERARRNSGVALRLTGQRRHVPDWPVVYEVLPPDDAPIPSPEVAPPVPRHYPRYRFQRGKLRRSLILGKRAAYTDWRHNVIVTGRVAIECEEAMPPNMLEGDRRRRMAQLRVAGYIVGESEG